MMLKLFISASKSLKKEYICVLVNGEDTSRIIPEMQPTKDNFYTKKPINEKSLEGYFLIYSKVIEELTFNELDDFFASFAMSNPEYLI